MHELKYKIFTVRSLFDKMNFHKIGGTLFLNVEENALIIAMKSDF